MKVVIIGGGASGIAASILLRRKGYEVIVLEKNKEPLKKLLLTGSGKCNFYNKEISSTCYHSQNKEFMDKVITKENSDKVYDFFHSIGLIYQERNGYLYPYTNTSMTMKSLLLEEARCLGVEILCNEEVTSIRKEDSFYITSTTRKLKCDKVILATGSIAGLRDMETALPLIESLGHSIIPIKPSLVQLIGNASYFKDWNGIRAKGKVSLYENNSLKDSEVGEIQFTEYGLSGVCILNLSHDVVMGLSKNKKEVIEIDFLPEVSDVKSFLEERNTLLKKRTIVELLESCIDYRLLFILLKQSKIDKNSILEDLSEERLEKLCSNLKHFKVEIVDTKDLTHAQVASGGVDTLELTSTLESKIIPGLYFTGEVIDIDGKCGGYNLGFAWISALLVSEDIK